MYRKRRPGAVRTRPQHCQSPIETPKQVSDNNRYGAKMNISRERLIAWVLVGTAALGGLTAQMAANKVQSDKARRAVAIPEGAIGIMKHCDITPTKTIVVKQSDSDGLGRIIEQNVNFVREDELKHETTSGIYVLRDDPHSGLNNVNSSTIMAGDVVSIPANCSLENFSYKIAP